VDGGAGSAAGDGSTFVRYITLKPNGNANILLLIDDLVDFDLSSLRCHGKTSKG
jgi:hypothetical protein